MGSPGAEPVVPRFSFRRDVSHCPCIPSGALPLNSTKDCLPSRHSLRKSMCRFLLWGMRTCRAPCLPNPQGQKHAHAPARKHARLFAKWVSRGPKALRRNPEGRAPCGMEGLCPSWGSEAKPLVVRNAKRPPKREVRNRRLQHRPPVTACRAGRSGRCLA